ncbi:hypothetical protein [Xanthomonas rydalmerensis]|uniref:Uncharacterized protein n=1 Tax=Xanthomonas rydalmerensis TaxID=3046274 RepID=A0ABZ0JNH7_9XANT|nr:hypothetical protein [Xanthomonas sp. DM-2023]WOS40702.1 hypothetical protein QN243_20290 [Xanthomonas sp. DM-2023]WOS44886.1 hypothetical protein QN242_20290 [Xanthomonas sp. DM-2023]WOS49066.1 hypothetical protein QN240_20290 [Xanthomonas sp. DM-2023]WOS53246.1 hypothetical protein QN244_20295 [Xanthomonas sp. DM-2023]WOS57429.1 hypothetical protein QN245_20290 [Xanthomonas sp. DM-2023]
MANDSVQEKPVYGMTVAQWDELQERMRLMHAVCDAFTTRAANDMLEQSISTLARLGFDAGCDAEKLLAAISEQRVGEAA